MEETNIENNVQVENVQSAERVNEQIPLMPKNNMVLAIVTTICCCLPLGIVAIIKASQVNSLYLAKQYAAAQKSADDAKKWALIGLACGFVFDVLYFIVCGASALMNL